MPEVNLKGNLSYLATTERHANVKAQTESETSKQKGEHSK